MKTKKLFLLGILGISFQILNAQATTASTTNTVAASAYIGSGASSNFDVQFRRNNVGAGKIATTFTSFGLNSIAMPSSVSIGVNAGQFSSSVGSNTYIGQNAGKGSSSTILNSGTGNTYVGYNTGLINTTGYSNVSIGISAGTSNTTGFGNVKIGSYAGADNNIGNRNVFIGTDAGTENDGSNNIFIGTNAGMSQTGSNQLIIENTSILNQVPLILGNFELDQLKFNGKVGIGGNSTIEFGNYPITANNVNVSSYNLFVKGGILTEEVRVSLATTWADYVFNKDYNLKPLSEVEQFILKNGHLPNVPSANQVKEEGIELGEMAKIQQEKIEELTLYLIQQHKEIQELKTQLGLILDKR